MNNSIDKKRVYHPWDKWEDYTFSFYENCTGKDKDIKIAQVLDMFSSLESTRECMFFVVDNWKHSMEHNLTNKSMNRIAYIGQCACAYYKNIPSTITMEAWSSLDSETQKRADKIAQEAIDRWSKNNQFIQICLNLD